MTTHKIFYTAKPIGSIVNLATALGFTETFLRRVSENPSSHYTPFTKVVKNKERNLCEPKPHLKTLQKRINTRIFSHIKFPSYLHGGIKTADPRDFVSNASRHRDAETAIALDIQSFFPSIKTEQVKDVFKNLLNFPEHVSELLANLVTLDGCLPQGAPTSSYISNLIMWEKECRLVSKFEGRGLVYTRLIDDMTISSKSRISEKLLSTIISEVAGMLNSYGYVLHPDKKKILSRSDPENLMLITGLWLNRGSPKLLKARRLEISHSVMEVRRLANHSNMIYEEKYHALHSSCSGKVALLQRLGHSRSLRLRTILNSVQPKYDSSQCHKLGLLIKKFAATGISKNDLGYIKMFYDFQHKISIIKRTDTVLARKLQTVINKVRPKITKRELID